METSAYAIESQVEVSHWWFVGRRKLLAKIISKLDLSMDTRVLDIGTGTGTNLRLLKELGFENVMGVDNSEESVHFCAQKGLGIVQKGDICNLPFEDNSAGLILATDVIEHIDNDLLALSELKRILSPNGWLILTVPAFQSLWGLQDQVGHHKRRYRLRQLQQLLQEVDLDCEESFYFNYLLFIPIWLARQLISFFRVPLDSESQLNTPLLNYLLTSIFTIDITTARFVKPPFGVSILVVARKGFAMN